MLNVGVTASSSADSDYSQFDFEVSSGYICAAREQKQFLQWNPADVTGLPEVFSVGRTAFGSPKGWNAHGVRKSCPDRGSVVGNSSWHWRACPIAVSNVDSGSRAVPRKAASDSASRSYFRRVAEEDECAAARFQLTSEGQPAFPTPRGS